MRPGWDQTHDPGSAVRLASVARHVTDCAMQPGYDKHLNLSTVKPFLSGHSKRRPKIGFQDRLLLNAGRKYCRMLQESILQYFRPSFNYHLSLRPFVLSVFEWRFKTNLPRKNAWLETEGQWVRASLASLRCGPWARHILAQYWFNPGRPVSV